jgi:flagellar hook-associated protein 2
VTASEDALSTALSSFATAYNSAVDALASQRGQSGGALAGDSIVFSLGDTLSQISQFGTGAGGVQSLSDLGLDLDSTGHLSFDSTAFNSQSATAIQQFLGTTTSGGFLQTANDALTDMSDPTTGVLAAQITSIGNEITNENNEITDEQSRVTDLQNSLQAQLSAADAAIATLESQKTYYTDLFATENANNSAGIG